MINVIAGGLEIPAEIRQKVREMFLGGSDLEVILRWLRGAGQFQGQSYKLLREEGGLSYIEAKNAVHNSTTWADCRETTEQLHDTAYQAALDAGFVETIPERSLEVHRKRA